VFHEPTYAVCVGGAPEHAAKVGSFVGGALSSSARAPLTGQLTTFSHAIDAPSSQLRIQVCYLQYIVCSKEELEI
jgi:hypothetical protein